MDARRTYSLLSIAALSVVLALWTQMPDFDLWSRLQVGSIVWQTGTPLMHDVFSYLPTKAMWVDHEWGAGLVFYVFVLVFGNAGLFVVKGTLLALTFWGVAKAAKVRAEKLPGLLFLALLSWAIFPGIGSLVRSQAFTFALFALWLWGLESLRAGRGRVLWIFPISMLAWANLHGGFMAGLGLAVLYAVGEALSNRPVRLYLLALVLSLQATLITPYGLHLWQYVVEASLMPRPFVAEWAPIWQFPARMWAGYLPMAALAALTLVRRYDWSRAIVLIPLAALGAEHQRHLVFFALATAALCYEDVLWLLDRVLRPIGAEWRIALTAGLVAVLVGAATVFCPNFSTRLDVRGDVYPVSSLAFLQLNRIKGNVAVPFNWGSIASWWLHPDCRVLIDGRYEEVYPPEVFSLGADFSLGTDGWKDALRRYHTDAIILPKNAYSPDAVRELPEWEAVFADMVSVVLFPRTRAVQQVTEVPSGMFVDLDLGKPVSIGRSDLPLGNVKR